MDIDRDGKSFHAAMAIFSVLFVSSEPLSQNVIKERFAIPGEEFEKGMELLKAIIDNYTPLRIQEAQDKVALTTRAEYGGYIKALLKTKRSRLTGASLETLAVVAYKQPVTKTEVDRIRGVDCESTLSQLHEEGLIRAIGSLSSPGAPLLYQTTEKFLLAFNLKGLADLPEIRQ
ncbi:MAG: SMC-Scp complex subunit ScpB [Thermodesulfovibrionales bacterium]|jgi:segregation and condensation protein B